MRRKKAENGGISTSQARAINALLTTKTIGQAAKAAGVGERTLSRWLAEAEFRAALASAEGALIDAAARRLIALQGAAIDTVEGLMSNSEIHPATRLRASVAVLEAAIKLRDLRNLELRIAALEAADNEGS